MEADVLWYVNDNDLQAPGKLYEYFASGRSILASVVEGYTRQQLLDSQGAICVPLEDVPALIHALEDLVARKSSNTMPQTPKAYSAQFERMKLTGELARHLEHLMDYDKAEITRLQEQR